MAEELVKELEKFHLTKEEETIIGGGQEDDEEQRIDMKVSLILKEGMAVRMVEANLFVFQFSSVSDKEKVVQGRPWFFDNQLLLLKETKGDDQISEVRFNESPCWIRVYELPFAKRNEQIAMSIRHIDKDCDDINGDGENTKEMVYKYGPWLRASPLRRNKMSKEESEHEKIMLNKLREFKRDNNRANVEATITKLGPPSMARRALFQEVQKEEVRKDKEVREKGDDMTNYYGNDNNEQHPSVDTRNVGNVGNSGGMGMWWRDINFSMTSYSRHHIMGNVVDQNGAVVWRPVGIYGWPETTNKHKTSVIVNAWKESPGMNVATKLEYSEKGAALANELDELHRLQEPYWYARARANDLRDGEKNTRYFHHKASQRRRRNHIKGIMNSDGDWCEKTDEIAKAVAGYFEEIFATENPSNFEEALEGVKCVYGEYTVKSAYWLARLGVTSVGSSMVQQGSIWNRIWNLECPPKLKHFVWRACSGSLAVKERLCRRKICTNASCPLCGEADETIAHALFECAGTKDLWEPSQLKHLVGGAPNGTMKEKWEWLCTHLNRGDLLQVGAIMWAAWFSRNKAVHEPEVRTNIITAAGFIKLVVDYVEYASRVFKIPHIQATYSTSWSPPPMGWVKVNTDANVIAGEKASIGAVIRDEKGALKAFGVRLVGPASVEIAEAEAARYGLMLARRLGFLRIILECDAIGVTNAINSKKQGETPIFSCLKTSKAI
ncbi:hypothetical protein RDABS01_008655 [Bienertia sinuspersici]